VSERVYRRPVRGPHVGEDTWVSLAAGDLSPEAKAAALAHVVTCEDCTRVWRGITALEDEARAGGVLPAQSRTPFTALRAAPWLAVAAGIALAVLLIQPAPRDTTTPAQDAPASDTRLAGDVGSTWSSAFPLSKAAVHVRPEEALNMRGGTIADDMPLADLAHALEPYRSEDYPEAVTRLRALADKYPRADRPHLYLGVSLLLLERPADAVAPLTVATASTFPAVATDAWWYLAVAHARSGDRQAALTLVEKLCSAPDPDARACAARDALAVVTR
jgi:tetratricopeptide (TPR) repeat protein